VIDAERPCFYRRFHLVKFTIKGINMNTRRQFLLHTLPATLGLGVALSASVKAHAQANRIDENTPAATALGYKHDASKIDRKKYPNYSAEKNCANCALYQGKATDPWANCAAVAGKQVNAKGWCIAWAKKA
jgi:hypothetical protein